MRCLIFLVLLTTTCVAQRQLTNFQSSDPVGSNPAGFVTFAGRGYFLATDATHGRNLWTSDGTPEGSRFFYELEPDKPTSAEFIPFITEDYLYVFSRKNLFRINRQHTITQLSSLTITQPARPERIGNRLFFDAFQYVDLTTGLIQTDNSGLSSIASFQSFWSETARLIYSWQTNLYRLQTTQGSDQSISRNVNEPAFTIRQLFEWGGNYYVLSTQWVLYAIRNGTFQQLDTPLMNFQAYSFDARTGVFAGLTTTGRTVETYRFDGTELKLTDRKEIVLPAIQPLLTEGNHVYALNAVPSGRNEPTRTLFRLRLDLGKVDTLSNFNTLVPTGESFAVLSARRLGPWLGMTVRAGTWNRTTTRMWLFNTETNQLLNRPYTDFGWLPETKTALAAKTLDLNPTMPTTELHAVRNGQEQLLRDEPGVLPNMMSFGTNFNHDAAYVALNEAGIGAAMYRLNAADYSLRRTYQNANERFFVNYGLSATAGLYVIEDLWVITYGTEPRLTYLYEYSANRSRVLAEPSGAVIDLPPALARVSVATEPSYLLRESGVFRQTTLNDAPRLIAPVRVGSGHSTYTFNGKLFFITDDERFPKHLMVFDPVKGLSRVFDQPIREIRQFRDQLLVSTQDRLYLVETHGAYQVRFLTEGLHWEQHFNVRSTSEFAFITTENEVWYTDGTCQRTRKLHTGEPARWAELIDPLPGQKEFIYRFDGVVYVFDGYIPRRFNADFKTLLGRTPTHFYWSNYGNNYTSRDQGGDLVVYRTHLKTFQTETLLTIARTSFNPYMISMSADRFLEVEEGKKWLFFWDRSVYEFSDKDDYRLTQNHPTSMYFSLLNRRNGRALLRRNNTLVAYENGLFRDITPELNFASLSEDMASLDYRYFLTFTAGSQRPDNLLRVSLTDFSIQQKKLPIAPKALRTNLDINRPFPLMVLTTGLYGILETPGSGQQLWLLDEARQTFPTAQTVAYEAFSPVSWCTPEAVNQPVPTEFDAQVGVFPNPTNRYVYVNLFTDYDPATVQLSVIGLDGRVVREVAPVRPTALSKQVVELNLQDLSVGTYHIRVNAGGQVRVWKVLIL